MSLSITAQLEKRKYSRVEKGGIRAQLEKTGRLPPVEIQITPLDGTAKVFLNRFLGYSFTSSILIPVDTFSFDFVAPDDERPLNDIIKEGDIITLYGNGIPLSTGIIDQTQIETDADAGEKAQINGRDLMGQMEDQETVSIQNEPIYMTDVTCRRGVERLVEGTRIRRVVLQDAPTSTFLLAAEPSETKLSALQRFIEPMNCIAWMSPIGEMNIGRPNMAQASKGTVKLSKSQRESNVLSMSATRGSTTIPNVILPIWAGQEEVQSRISAQNALENTARGPARLRNQGHFLQKTVVVSNPQGSSPQDASRVNDLRVASNISQQQANQAGPIPGGSTLLQAYALRELARQNYKELIVQAVVPGHYNENGEPWLTDTVYRVIYDRGDVDKEMYLFQIDYMLSGDSGQTTRLYFCNLNTIVSGIRVK